MSWTTPIVVTAILLGWILIGLAVGLILGRVLRLNGTDDTPAPEPEEDNTVRLRRLRVVEDALDETGAAADVIAWPFRPGRDLPPTA